MHNQVSYKRKHERTSLEMSQSGIDMADPAFLDADLIFRRMTASGFLKDRVPEINVIRQLMSLIPKREVVTVREDPEMVELKRQEIAQRDQQTRGSIENARIKAERIAKELEHKKSMNTIFRDVAKDYLPEADYLALVNIALERQAAIDGTSQA